MMEMLSRPQQGDFMQRFDPSGPIGQHLVWRGILTQGQVQAILNHQRKHGQAFGAIAERWFGVLAQDIDQAWADQYAALDTACDLDDETVDPGVTRAIGRRQAWQMQLLPLRVEDGVIVAATTRDNLPRAMRFAWRHFDRPVYLRVADHDQLRAHLQRHHPWPTLAAHAVAPATLRLSDQ